MIMPSTHYLPHEELKPSNYPEVIQLEAEIGRIEEQAMIVDIALFAYNEDSANRIDVDVVELRKAVELCRSVCEVLGNAPNVCYDILMEIRSFQLGFQELIFMKNRFGSEYIGKPSVDEEDEFEYEYGGG